MDTTHTRNGNRTSGDTRAPMDKTRKAAVIAGALYLVTFVASIPALPLYHDLLKNPRYVLSGASHTGVLVGAALEIICAIAAIGTAVFLFPIVKRQSEAAALGFVAARVLEASMIFVGVLSVLSVVTLQQHGATGAEAASTLTAGRSLVALHDWTFLLGPGIIPAVNALCLATVLYKTRLVPRIIPTLGLIGAPMLLASATATLFGAWDQVSGPSFVLTLPIAVWEFSLGAWMLFKGFRPAAVLELESASVLDLTAAVIPVPVSVTA
jgi:hypothetical protein